MILARCPHCQTTFRVRPEQLRVAQGRVRCGKCGKPFDAQAHQVEGLPPAPRPVAPSEHHAAPPTLFPPEFAPRPVSPRAEPERAAEVPVRAPQPEPAAGEEVGGTGSVDLDVGEPTRGPVDEEIGAPPQQGPDIPLEASVPPPAPEPEAEIKAESEPEAEGFAARLERDAAQTEGRRWPWVTGVAAATLLLALQTVFTYRTELATHYPSWRPALEGVCGMLGCEVPLPHQPEYVSIENSDLHPEGEARNRLLLLATLKNRAPFAQAYPHLEVTLTDTGDAPLVRRVLAPAEYLPDAAAAAAPFSANSETSLRLILETGSVPASGYRLYVFYP